MNERERFLRTMRYQEVNRPPLLPCGPWVETLARWRREGLPPDTSLEDYLGLSPLRSVYLGPTTGVFPQFEETVLEEDERMVIFIDRNGITNRRIKHSSAMPEYLEYPIKTPRDLETFMEERFGLDRIEERYPPDWDKRMQIGADPDRDVITFVDGGCIFGWLRRLAGVERASYLFYEAPELVDRFMGRVHEIAMRGLERVLPRVTPDYLGFGEDIAFRTSTLISPDMFKRFLYERYRASCKLAAAHGVDICWYDSDGHLYPFMDLYLEVGIRGFAPMEVAAGMDPVVMRQRYGNAVHMVGGFDKRILAAGKAKIEKEVERLLPVIAGGGYIPACDHHVPPDVSLENYTFFVNCWMGALS